MADSSDKFLKGFIFGGVVGGLLGVLFAPKSGEETREELSEETDKLIAQLKIDIESAKKAALQSFDENKDRIISKLIPDQEKKGDIPDVEEDAQKEEKPEEKRPRRRRPPRDKSEKKTKTKS